MVMKVKAVKLERHSPAGTISRGFDSVGVGAVPSYGRVCGHYVGGQCGASQPFLLPIPSMTVTPFLVGGALSQGAKGAGLCVQTSAF